MNYIWAIDPFVENSKVFDMGARILKGIKGPKDKISAVYVASPAEPRLSMAFDVPDIERFSAYPHRLAMDHIKRTPLTPIDLEVLYEPDVSLSSAIKRLAQYTKKKRGDLILLSTHGRKGLERLFMGSFAEALTHGSAIDLLLYKIQTEASDIAPTPKRLLYAHDFSTKGDRGLLKALRYAKSWQAELDVVHVPEPVYQFKFKGQDKKVESYRKSIDRKRKSLEVRLRNSAVPVRIHLETNWNLESTWKTHSDMVHEAALRLKSDVIVVAAQTGKFAALLGGSLTRQLLNVSHTPVLVLKVR